MNVFISGATGFIGKNLVGHLSKNYTVIAPTSTTTIVEKEDGMYNKTEFTKGRYIAIDKFGVKYKGWYWSIISKIDYDVMQQFYSK